MSTDTQKLEPQIRARIIPFECSDEDWKTLNHYFELRHRVFNENKGWQLNDFNGFELDAYDNETAFYAIAENAAIGELLGGARLGPTCHPMHRMVGSDDASFMIGDAFDGLLDSIPNTICFEAPPVALNVWELTRVTVTQPNVADLLLKTANDFLNSRGVSKCVALGSPAVMRVARKLGYSPKPIGPVVQNDSGRFLAFTCQVIKTDPAPH